MSQVARLISLNHKDLDWVLIFGAQYKWNDFQFSIAALDLGFMNWGKTQKASTDGTQIVNTNSFIFSADKENEHYFDKEWDRLTDDIAKLYQMSDVEEISSRTRALSTTLNFGVEYELLRYIDVFILDC